MIKYLPQCLVRCMDAAGCQDTYIAAFISAKQRTLNKQYFMFYFTLCQQHKTFITQREYILFVKCTYRRESCTVFFAYSEHYSQI